MAPGPWSTAPAPASRGRPNVEPVARCVATSGRPVRPEGWSSPTMRWRRPRAERPPGGRRRRRGWPACRSHTSVGCRLCTRPSSPAPRPRCCPRSTSRASAAARPRHARVARPDRAPRIDPPCSGSCSAAAPGRAAQQHGDDVRPDRRAERRRVRRKAARRVEVRSPTTARSTAGTDAAALLSGRDGPEGPRWLALHR